MEDADVIKDSYFGEKPIKDAFVNKDLQNIPVFFYEQTDSTNTRAKLYEGSEEKICLFVADRQTEGRGRMGRSFESEGGVGIYASLLLLGEYEPSDAVLITVRMAVAICRAIESLTGASPKIKWVNDIILNGRKLAGILTEGVFDKNGRIERIISGFGINVYKRSFSGELTNIATTLEDGAKEIPSRAIILSRVCEQFLKMPDFSEVLDEYRRRSTLIGKAVTVRRIDESYPARVISITDDAHLLVRREDGTEEALFSGEVSVRE